MRHFYSYEILNRPSALQSLTLELDSALNRDIADSGVRSTVLLVVDELVSNLLKHGFEAGTDQRSHLTIDIDEDWLQIDLKDNGKEFNPLVRPKPHSLGQGLNDRAVGGLGIYLVLRIMDESHYERNDPWNCLRLRKNIKGRQDDRKN